MRKLGKMALALGLAATFVLSGCTPKEKQGEKEVEISKNRTTITSNELQFAPLAEGTKIAVIETNKGMIKAALFPQEAPLAVENFIGLSEKGVYNTTKFHRVEKDFVIQGGDPTGTGKGGESIWGEPFKSEYSDKMHHYSGALCMATGDDTPNTNLSQFYIVASPQGNITPEIAEKMKQAAYRPEVIEAYTKAGGEPYLDKKATVFGQVIEGMDVVDKIANTAVDETGTPKKEIEIVSVTIETYPAQAGVVSSNTQSTEPESK